MSSTPGRRQSSENANQEDTMGSIVVSQFVTLDGGDRKSVV